MKISEKQLRSLIQESFLKEVATGIPSLKIGKYILDSFFKEKPCIEPKEKFALTNIRVPKITGIEWDTTVKNGQKWPVIRFLPKDHLMEDITTKAWIQRIYNWKKKKFSEIEDEIDILENHIVNGMNKFYEIIYFYFNDNIFQKNFHCLFGKNFDHSVFKKVLNDHFDGLVFAGKGSLEGNKIYINTSDIDATLFHEICGHLLDDIFLFAKPNSVYNHSKDKNSIIIKNLETLTGMKNLTGRNLSRDTHDEDASYFHDELKRSDSGRDYTFKKFGIKEDNLRTMFIKLKAAEKQKGGLLKHLSYIFGDPTGGKKMKLSEINKLSAGELAKRLMTDLRHKMNTHHIYNSFRMMYIHIRYHENKLKTFSGTIRNKAGKLSEKFIAEMITFKLPKKFYQSPKSTITDFMRIIFMFSNISKFKENVKIIQEQEFRSPGRR